MTSRATIKQLKRWVIKVGSALLTDDGQGLNVSFIEQLASQISFLREQGVEVVLVSSGSVAAGVSQLGLSKRPDDMSEIQAAAAVGQASLIRHYEDAFRPYGLHTAQVLLTHADIANRERYLNAKSTLTKLLEFNVLTVVNENDTVATDEICFGDNDSLGALVANLVEADVLVILTDQQGLYTSDPRNNPGAELLYEVDAGDDRLLEMATGGSDVGRGGMVTKLGAANTARRSGASTLIAYGRERDVLQRLYEGEVLGTLLVAKERVASRKQWMAGQMKIAGSVSVDPGAAKVLKTSGKSLLAVGVTAVNGDFQRGELISCIDVNGNAVARGLSNYSSAEVLKIKGQPSERISEVLGYAGNSELIHRDNLVLV